MKTLGILTAVAVACSATSGFASTYADRFTSYIAFGDSLTDNGKFGPGSLAPPSFDGRFTNGFTYAEQIAADFAGAGKFSTNLALGGATAETDNENVPFYPAEALPFATFGSQIATLAAALSDPLNSIEPIVGNNPLFSVVFGGNDLLQDLGESATIGQDAADAVKAGIEAIAALNDNYTTFVVGTLGDLGATPLFNGTAAAGLATQTALDFNTQLRRNIQMLRADGLRIVNYDLAKLTADIAANPSALGITDIVNPCTPSFNAFTPLDNCAFDPLTNEIDLSAADAFLFADNVHPSGVVQTASAELFRTNVAAVPLPAGLWLMLGGLALLNVLRRRGSAV